MKLERIVIGTDFSDASVAAARWSVRRFAPGAEVVLVHVVTVPEPPKFLRGRFPPPDTLIATARTGAEARLRELSPSLGVEHIRTETRVGLAWEQLDQAAAAYDADAIVVGRHGARASVWGHLGSTAEMLVRASKVPILLAAGLRDTKLRHVLAAVDDSDAAPAVVAWARYFAVRDGVHVTAFHVVTTAVLEKVLARATGGAVDSGDGEGDFKQGVHHDADRWVEGLLGPGVPPERVASEVAFGEAGQEILRAAERHDSDLIVTGSHGGTMRHFIVGSVAAEVLHGAACPVLVVKAPEDEIVD